MRHLRRCLATAVLAAPLLLAGCVDYSGLQFVQDHRLTFTRPENNELVETPLTLSWRMADFTVLPRQSEAEPSEGEGYFAVFVDVAPVEPGHTLQDVAEGDDACVRDPRCPDRRYLNAKGVYVTHRPRLTLDVIAPLVNKEEVQRHEITVVLLDADGRRIGESAWYLKVKMENRTPVI